MASTLTGTQIKNTYPALLKLGDNGSLPSLTQSTISDGLGNNTPLQVSQTRFNTQYLTSNIGLDLDFPNNTYTIGDYDFTSTTTQLKVDVNGQYIITNSNGGFRGFYLDFFNDSYQFGDINGVTNANLFVVNNGTSIIKTMKSGADKGLKINFPNKVYSLGDFNAVDNGTSIIIDDANEAITLEANTQIEFKGTGLTSTTAGSTNALHLRIFINGVPYKIQLRNDV